MAKLQPMLFIYCMKIVNGENYSIERMRFMRLSSKTVRTERESNTYITCMDKKVYILQSTLYNNHAQRFYTCILRVCDVLCGVCVLDLSSMYPAQMSD